MEPVTHFLTGACLGRAGLNRKTGLATLTLALATEAPDIDFVSLLGGSVANLEHHRGFTHTLLGAPFVGALTLGTVYGIYRFLLSRQWKIRQPPNWKLLYLYAVFGCLVHIFMDFLNNYGVRPFAPFYPRWFSWDIVFIVDPIILVLLFLGLVTPALFSLVTEEIGARKPAFRGRGGAMTALVLIVALVALRDFEHRKAVNALNALTYHDEEPVKASAFPSPMNPFLWSGVVETQSFFESASVDTWAAEVDPQGTASIRYKPEETPVTLAAKKSRLGRVYLDWSQYPVVEAGRSPDGKGYRVRFFDLRFMSLGIRRSPVLAGTVILDSNLKVLDMYTGERK
ncbi:MAG TPA: metal-dependent hydrolase [Candidatus Saccharimonadales bacterium]|nr:metal-dependent hydrolase [Candidatus Saccharimonadales bacterium]